MEIMNLMPLVESIQTQYNFIKELSSEENQDLLDCQVDKLLNQVYTLISNLVLYRVKGYAFVRAEAVVLIKEMRSGKRPMSEQVLRDIDNTAPIFMELLNCMDTLDRDLSSMLLLVV